jgi:hypothetical protein
MGPLLGGYITSVLYKTFFFFKVNWAGLVLPNEPAPILNTSALIVTSFVTPTPGQDCDFTNFTWSGTWLYLTSIYFYFDLTNLSWTKTSLVTYNIKESHLFKKKTRIHKIVLSYLLS